MSPAGKSLAEIRPIQVRSIPERQSFPRGRSLFEWAEVAFIVSAVLGASLALAKDALDLVRPFQMDYGEGQVLALAARVAHGLSPYPPATKLPYIVNLYGPLPAYLFGACVKLFGRSFTMPRVLVVVAAVWCAVMVALLARHLGGAPHVSLAFGLFFLTRPVVQNWESLLRVDLVGLAFALTGLYVFANSRRWYLSPIFFVAAAFSKPTLVAAPAACLVYAILKKEGVKAFRFGSACTVLGGLAFLIAQRQTHGWFGYDMCWVHAQEPYSLQSAFSFLRSQFWEDRYVILLALPTVHYARARPALRLPLIYLGFSLLTTLTVGKSGASFNYFLEWEAALCLCAGVAYEFLRPVWSTSELRTLAFRSGPPAPPGFESEMHPGKPPYRLVALLPAALPLLILPGTYKKLRPSPVLSGCSQAYEYVKNSGGRVDLSENVSALSLDRKALLVFDPSLWTHEVEDQGWFDGDVVQLIRSHQIPLIVLSSDVESLQRKGRGGGGRRWPTSVLHAVGENYRLAGEFNCLDARAMYVPKVQH